jgi:fibronectin type 3 domain-containing protein
VADPRVVKYRIYFGTASRTYLQARGQGLDASGTNYTVTNLQSGRRYYFAVTAVDATGAESDYSNEATKAFP